MAEENHYQELDDVEAQTQDVPKSRGLLKYFVGVTMVALVFCGLVAHSSMVQTNTTTSLIASGDLNKCQECIMKCYEPNAKCSPKKKFECKNACKHPREDASPGNYCDFENDNFIAIGRPFWPSDLKKCQGCMLKCNNPNEKCTKKEKAECRSACKFHPGEGDQQNFCDFPIDFPPHDNLIASGGERERCLSFCKEASYHWSDKVYEQCKHHCKTQYPPKDSTSLNVSQSVAGGLPEISGGLPPHDNLIARGGPDWPSGGGVKKCKECMLQCYDPNAKQKCSNEQLFECKNACKFHPGEDVSKSEVSLSARGDERNLKCMGDCEEEAFDGDWSDEQLTECQVDCDKRFPPKDSTSLNVLQSESAGGLAEISGGLPSHDNLIASGGCMADCDQEWSDCVDKICNDDVPSTGDEKMCNDQLIKCQDDCGKRSPPEDSTSKSEMSLIASGSERERCLSDCDEELPVHHWSDEEYHKCQDDCDKRARKREQCEYEHIDGYGLFDKKCGIYSKYEMKSQEDIDCVCNVYEDTCNFKPAFCQEKKCAAFLAGAASGGERCSDECITDGDCITLCNCP